MLRFRHMSHSIVIVLKIQEIFTFYISNNLRKHETICHPSRIREHFEN